MPIIPPGYGQVLMPISHGDVSRDAAITWGVDMNSQGGSTGLANKIQGDFTSEFAAVFDDAVTLGPLRLAVGQDGGDALVFVASATTVGTSAQASMPSNVALLVRKLTARGGRRGRGRFYIPWCLSDGAVDDTGNVLGATVTNLQTRADDFLANLQADIGPTLATPMVLLHSEGASSTGLPNEVTELVVQAIIGTQRRRIVR